jgi:hypothetical protein
MIAAAILASSLLLPVGNTTWWRTEGAEVIQEADQNACALFVFQRGDAVGFMWDKVALTGIVFFNDKWNFSPSETRAAVRIGRDWVSATPDVEWFRATEQKNALVVPIRYYPVERLLNNANSVTLRHDGADFNVPLDRTKMPKLLAAAVECRNHLL